MAPAGTSHERLASLAVGPLLLVTPFIVFARHHGYPLLRGEILVTAGALALVGLAVGAAMAWGRREIRVLGVALLVTHFADMQMDLPGVWNLAPFFAVAAIGGWLLREHLAVIASTVGATLLLTTLVVPSGRAVLAQVRLDAEPAGSHAPPPVLHLILDEQIGVEGIPRELDPGGEEARRLTDFYTERGFRVFGRAYSRFFHTAAALPNLVNFARSDVWEPGVQKPGYSVMLTANAYFEQMTRRGYRIQVVQPGYVDFCQSWGAIALASCLTYTVETIDAVKDAPIPIASKLRAILGMYPRKSIVLVGILKRVESLFNAFGWPNPWELVLVSPLTSMHVLEQLISELPRIQPGSLVFVHLLLPHQPYAYDAACRLRPLYRRWVQAHAPVPKPRHNTPESRAERYPLYFEQMTCLHTKLGELFDAMQAAGVFDSTRIVVHGDHGSRIFLFEPDVKFEDRLTPGDYLDTFSTLFVVKEPGVPAGYDLRQLALDELFEAWMRGELAVARPGGSPWVFLAEPPHLARRPMPVFEEGVGGRAAGRGGAPGR